MNKRIFFELKGIGDNFYCFLKVKGRLTHSDYEEFVPLFESSLALVKEPKVKVLADITELDGWELEAAWDDLKFGLSHSNEFEKIAVVGNRDLYKYGVKISNWFTSYEMQYFDNLDEAKEWLF